MPTPPRMLPATAGRNHVRKASQGALRVDAGEDLSAGGDAVGEVAETDDVPWA